MKAKELVENDQADKVEDLIVKTPKTSKYKGVTWNKKNEKWAAYSYIRVHHGLFDSEEEAHQAVEKYREYRKNNTES